MSHRDDTVMMARIRNEERWIERSLERTWPVAKTIVLWDDGSDDRTNQRAVLASFGEDANRYLEPRTRNGITRFSSGERTLIYVKSLFRPAENQRYAVNEIRDKNALWEVVKAQSNFKYVLCMDGDEMLSNDFLRRAPEMWKLMDDHIDILHLSFIYLWDSETMRRVDGIYGDNQPGYAKLNFPRLFTTQRWTEQQIFDSHFDWQGSKGGFHCGSIPRSQAKIDMKAGHMPGPVIHFGYIDDPLRQRKFVFYNEIDPNNQFEGEYKHIIGIPNIHAPGAVELVPWSDD